MSSTDTLSAAPAPADAAPTFASTPPPTTLATLTASLAAGVMVAWPLSAAALLHGPRVVLRSLTGDSYHYLAIARKALQSGIYTYDGVHVTNGFHPLWGYFLRGLFTLLHLQTPEAQGIAAIFAALAATTAGVMLASAAIVRITGSRLMAMLLVPGVYYLAVGVQVRNQAIWSTLDGMESAFSTLFGGLLFFIWSFYAGRAARRRFVPLQAARALGLVLPFVVLSRLDDVFLLPALTFAFYLFKPSPLPAGAHGKRRRYDLSPLWLAGPTAIAVICYMVYNKVTVGAPMPLSGGTKFGFSGGVAAYLLAAVHFPPILDLKALLTHTPVDGAAVFSNSFRFVEMVYPLLAAAFAALWLWRRRIGRPQSMLFFAISLYILFKLGYNFLFVQPWNQAEWYYALISLSLSMMAACALAKPWQMLRQVPLARAGVAVGYGLIMLLAASQYYAGIVYQPLEASTDDFWARRDLVRQQLTAHGVHGVINVDDGITAFLLDLPMLHGFAFATDIEAQRGHRAGKMLTLGVARHIDAIAGYKYLSAAAPLPTTDADIHTYLRNSLAWETMKGEADDYEFSLAYYDPVMKMPFFAFRHR